jgi:cobaltochelatase CobN
MNRLLRFFKPILTLGLLVLATTLAVVLIGRSREAHALATPERPVARVALLSTTFVLERKFKLMAEAMRREGVELSWVQVDRAAPAGGETAALRALESARLVILDAPRSDDSAAIDKVAGKLLRQRALPTVSINVMSPPNRLRVINLDTAKGQQLFDYYVGGTATNHARLALYLRALLTEGDTHSVPPPLALPNGGIYHPGFDNPVFATLPDYLAAWERKSGQRWQGRPVIGMEMSSTYISDGQTRLLDATVQAIEARGGVPLLFYRSSRVARAQAERPAQGAANGARPGRSAAAAQPVEAASGPAFPNPKERRLVEVNEPLITLDGRVILNVLMVNTFLGSDPEARKAWHQAMGIPVINVVHYRTGNRADYAKDLAGISSFYLPFTLTTAEYIGLQDPVVVSTNEGGELVPMPEQMELMIGKALNLASLQTRPNADKQVALVFWNHPPGEKNQGASNLNVPRSIEYLVERLRAEGYAFDAVKEQQIIDAVGVMLRPVYRKGALPELMQSAHWDFIPLAHYKRWYATLPAAKRAEIEQFWGQPEKSPWIARREGQSGFVIPRFKLGKLVVLPQMPRGEIADDNEKKLFHDTKLPVNHFYLAGYLWMREQFKADAIVHFGTHGTQEWTPGKERGLWAFDDPNLLVGNTPIVYPYIVDNISEAIHVKRRGRGVIVSHQTPAFSPAGLSDDFVKLNDLLREYQSADEGLLRDSSKKLILAQALKMNVHKDLKLTPEQLERDFEQLERDFEDYLEDLGSAMQPLGLHTLGRDTERAHTISNVMQMLGQPLYEAMGLKSARAAFTGDYRQIQASKPYRFVDEVVMSDTPLDTIADPVQRRLAERGRKYAHDLRAEHEVEGVLKGLSARWIDPSYGGDPIRNPDALHTGRNMYGFDPGRVPTRAAYEAGKVALDNLVSTYQQTHQGRFPEKLAFTMWSTETMRHLGMLEAQILWAMGVRPTWDEGGRVTGMELVPSTELKRPRIDAVISLTGLYRDQFPNVMERFNEAIALLAALDDEGQAGGVRNFVRANTQRIEAQMLKAGLPAAEARQFALTRIFGNESGDYGTKLPEATLASDHWEEGDGKLEKLYLSRMSWAYGPDTAQWSRKYQGGNGQDLNAYAEHLRGTSAAVFSRSSNLRGLLDTDHPFEYLGGISMAVKHLDGTAPQLYISNMRDPAKAKLETAERFMANELRSVYQHPNWMAEMKKEGYSGTLQMLNTVNNFWGWQVMDRNVVRDDQWQEFVESYVKDRYNLGMREWFEKSNPTALAQIAERMIEAARKNYWKADADTLRELVSTYQDLATRHDVHTSNEAFKKFVADVAAGFGLGTPSGMRPARPADASRPTPTVQAEARPPSPPEVTPPTVRGQQLREVPMSPQEKLIWTYAALIGAVLLLGIGWQAWRTRREQL